MLPPTELWRSLPETLLPLRDSAAAWWARRRTNTPTRWRRDREKQRWATEKTTAINLSPCSRVLLAEVPCQFISASIVVFVVSRYSTQMALRPWAVLLYVPVSPSSVLNGQSLVLLRRLQREGRVPTRLTGNAGGRKQILGPLHHTEHERSNNQPALHVVAP